MTAHAVEVVRENADKLGKFVWRFQYRPHENRLSLDRFTLLLRPTRRHSYKVSSYWTPDNRGRDPSQLWTATKLTRDAVFFTPDIAEEARAMWIRDSLNGGVEGLVETNKG